MIEQGAGANVAFIIGIDLEEIRFDSGNLCYTEKSIISWNDWMGIFILIL